MPDKYIGAEGLAAIKTWTLSLLGSNSPTGFKSTIGDGSALEYTITHNLGTQDVIIQLWAVSDTDDVPFYTASVIDGNSIKVTFDEAPAASSITVLILPVRV